MGCTYSGHRGADNIRSFRVYNVDDQGMELNRGRLEIRDSELVLYQRGKDEPIRWPLRWLRRYGCDDELFSFESGRRCATGTGIFAFKCTHAESLFNLVHETLEQAGEDDQRAQQQQHSVQQHQNPSAAHQNTHNIATSITRLPEGLRGISLLQSSQMGRGTVVSVRNNSSDNPMDASYVNGAAHLYVNGLDDHEYINTGPPPSAAALQMDETAALVDFLHNPPMNYAIIDHTDSSDNPDEVGQDAVHNAERGGGLPFADSTGRLSQPTGGGRRNRAEVSRLSMPNDITAAASQEAESALLQASDSDVFLDGPSDGPNNTNYVNVPVEERPPAHSASGSIPPPLNLFLPPTDEVELNYANITIQSPKQVNYIVIDHMSQNGDNNPSSCGVSGAGAAGVSNSNNSPISPTSCTSFPDSPSRKTRSYATIDFDRTQALSNTSRPVGQDEEGSRKTRHNSSISDMPS